MTERTGHLIKEYIFYEVEHRPIRIFSVSFELDIKVSYFVYTADGTEAFKNIHIELLDYITFLHTKQ